MVSGGSTLNGVHNLDVQICFYREVSFDLEFIKTPSTHAFCGTWMQINHQSTISNFGVPGLTAGLQTTFPAGISDGKAHVCPFTYWPTFFC